MRKKERHLRKATEELKRIALGTPAFLDNIEYIPDKSGMRSLLIIVRNPEDKDKRNFILRWLVPSSPKRQIRLDQCGTFVAARITGKNSTQKIIGEFAEHYKVETPEARSSCLLFLHSLARRGVVAIIEP